MVWYSLMHPDPAAALGPLDIGTPVRQVSLESPIATALMWAQPGDRVTASLPRGAVVLEVAAIDGAGGPRNDIVRAAATPGRQERLTWRRSVPAVAPHHAGDDDVRDTDPPLAADERADLTDKLLGRLPFDPFGVSRRLAKEAEARRRAAEAARQHRRAAATAGLSERDLAFRRARDAVAEALDELRASAERTVAAADPEPRPPFELLVLAQRQLRRLTDEVDQRRKAYRRLLPFPETSDYALRVMQKQEQTLDDAARSLDTLEHELRSVR